MNAGLGSCRTKTNLMRAFASECMSGMRYYLAENAAQSQQLAAIAKLFRFTAEQEKQHAKVFQELMGELSGSNIDITAGYPVVSTDDIQQLLDLTVINEAAEADTVYPEFARIAREEGFNAIAEKFELIGSIEQTHRIRFEYYAGLMRSGRLFRSDDSEERWICLNCGQIHTGSEPPQSCPVCGMPVGWRLREAEAELTFREMIQK